MEKHPRRAGRLTEADLDAIEERIDRSVDSSMKRWLLTLGVKAETPDDVIRAQRAFSFLFKLSKAADEAQGVVWKRVLNWIVVALGIVLATGFGVIVNGRAGLPSSHISGQ